MATYKSHYDTDSGEEGVPKKSGGGGGGMWGWLFPKDNITNVLDPASEKNEMKRRQEEIQHETQPWVVLFHCFGLFFHTFFIGLGYILITTYQTIVVGVPIDTTQYWIESFGKTFLLGGYFVLVQFLTGHPCYTSILSCIQAPVMALTYGREGARWSTFGKSFFVNLVKIGVIFGGWCLADLAGEYWNGGNWANISYPPSDLHAGFYDAWYGNFTWIVLIVGMTNAVDITLQYRRFYGDANNERSSKMWFWSISPYSYYYDSSIVVWSTALVMVRFGFFYTLFRSHLDLGMLFTAPIFSAQNRTALGSYIGAVFAGAGASYVYMLFVEAGPFYLKKYNEKQRLRYEEGGNTNNNNNDLEENLNNTSSSGKSHKGAPRIQLPSSYKKGGR